MWLWENVDSFVDSGQGSREEDGNMAALLGAVGELDYFTIAFKTSVSEHGLPQRRKRIFVLGVLSTWTKHNMRGSDEWEQFEKRFCAALRAMMIKPLPLSCCLLDESDSYVQAELRRRQEQAAKGLAKKAAGNPSWPELHSDYCRKTFNKRDATIAIPERVLGQIQNTSSRLKHACIFGPSKVDSDVSFEVSLGL